MQSVKEIGVHSSIRFTASYSCCHEARRRNLLFSLDRRLSDPVPILDVLKSIPCAHARCYTSCSFCGMIHLLLSWLLQCAHSGWIMGGVEVGGGGCGCPHKWVCYITLLLTHPPAFGNCFHMCGTHCNRKDCYVGIICNKDSATHLQHVLCAAVRGRDSAGE
jgi:hypothetical protein